VVWGGCLAAQAPLCNAQAVVTLIVASLVAGPTPERNSDPVHAVRVTRVTIQTVTPQAAVHRLRAATAVIHAPRVCDAGTRRYVQVFLHGTASLGFMVVQSAIRQQLVAVVARACTKPQIVLVFTFAHRRCEGVLRISRLNQQWRVGSEVATLEIVLAAVSRSGRQRRRVGPLGGRNCRNLRWVLRRVGQGWHKCRVRGTSGVLGWNQQRRLLGR
jgi:hypothetical protein